MITYCVLGPSPHTTMHDRLPVSCSKEEWHRQALAFLNTPSWTVEHAEVHDGREHWAINGLFTGVVQDDAPEPTVFRVEAIATDEISGAVRREVHGVDTWEEATTLIEVVVDNLSRGHEPFRRFSEPVAPPPVTVTLTDYQKVHARVKRLVALAGRELNPNVHERAVAAQRAADYLTAHPTPLRWLVPAGTQVRLVETKHLTTGLGPAAKHLKTTNARGANWFFEAQRVQGDQAAEALRAGWLQFERHGFTVFVPAGDVEVHL